MAKLKVELCIGFPTAVKRSVINVDDDELASCETDDEREDLLQGYWQDWANNHIDGSFKLVDE